MKEDFLRVQKVSATFLNFISFCTAWNPFLTVNLTHIFAIDKYLCFQQKSHSQLQQFKWIVITNESMTASKMYAHTMYIEWTTKDFLLFSKEIHIFYTSSKYVQNKVVVTNGLSENFYEISSAVKTFYCIFNKEIK
jgi:hypothetical protein